MPGIGQGIPFRIGSRGDHRHRLARADRLGLESVQLRGTIVPDGDLDVITVFASVSIVDHQAEHQWRPLLDPRGDEVILTAGPLQ